MITFPKGRRSKNMIAQAAGIVTKITPMTVEGSIHRTANQIRRVVGRVICFAMMNIVTATFARDLGIETEIRNLIARVETAGESIVATRGLVPQAEAATAVEVGHDPSAAGLELRATPSYWRAYHLA